MRRRLVGALKLIVGLALAPAAGALVAASIKSLGGLLSSPTDTQYFLIGCAAYPILHVATTGLGIDGPRRILYVLAHELTHAVAAWMSGYRIHRFVVGVDGGHVDMSESNLFVALAPYVLPLYALLVILAYRLWLWRFGTGSAASHEAFLLALGAALSFHWVFTIAALATVRQPDLALAGGALFSLVLIALGNGVTLLLGLKCLFPKLISLGQAGRLALELTAAIWTAPWRL